MKFLSLQQSKAEENYQLLLQQVFLLPPLGAQFYFPHTTATPQTPPRPAMRRLPLQVVRLLPQVIRITHLPPRTQPAAHRQLLATAPNLMDSYPVNTRHRTQDNMTEQEGAGFYGDIPPLKYKNTLTIGFQNVGGVPTTRGKIKDDFIRLGINKFNFDIFPVWPNRSSTGKRLMKKTNWSTDDDTGGRAATSILPTMYTQPTERQGNLEVQPYYPLARPPTESLQKAMIV